MDQDFVKAILNDIEKAGSSEEKISLLVVAFTELAEYNQQQTKILEYTVDTITNAKEAINAMMGTLGSLVEKHEETVQAITTNGSNILQMTEGLVKNSESINVLYEDVTKLYEYYNDASNRIEDVNTTLTDYVIKNS